MEIWSNEYYKKLLNDSGKYYYEEILKNIYQHNMNVRFRNKLGIKPLKYEIEAVISAIRKDHPEVFWVDLLTVEIITSAFFSAVRLEKYQTEYERNIMLEKCIKWRDWVISCIPRVFSEKEKIWLIFDYLARQIDYGIISEQHSQTIISAFSEGEHVSVCEGISKSFKYLCDSLGVPCIVVFGETKESNNIGHAWNIIECDNEMWHIDITCEIKKAHALGRAEKKKFLFKDYEMNEYIWDYVNVPKCS